jgi:hypothetical protein
MKFKVKNYYDNNCKEWEMMEKSESFLMETTSSKVKWWWKRKIIIKAKKCVSYSLCCDEI